MDDHADRLAAAIRTMLREQLERSPAIRAVAVELANWILAEADRLDADTKAVEVSGPAKENDEQPTQPETALEPSERGVVSLRIGNAIESVEVMGSKFDLLAANLATKQEHPVESGNHVENSPKEIDLSLVATRSRLKAESCRLFIERRQSEGDEICEPGVVSRMNTMITQARAMQECFLWVFWRYEEQPSDEQLRIIADCYDALADAAELCQTAIDPNGCLFNREMEMVFQLLAEADSALRVALTWTWLSSGDSDQDDAYLWLRRETSSRHVFLARYMTLADPADPHQMETLLSEIRTLEAMAADRKAQAKRIDSLFNTAKYHARRLPSEGVVDIHDCQRINEAMGVLESLGVPPADARLDEIRSMVRVGAFPDDAPAHRYLTAQQTIEVVVKSPNAADARTTSCWSNRVLEARELLAGGTIVIIGGEPRVDAIERIRDAFAVEEVKWVQLSEHGTCEPMRAPIARPETRLVLVLIKLCGHLHAEEARRCARNAEKPCVSLPAGYNPEQIAEQILEQAAERLRDIPLHPTPSAKGHPTPKTLTSTGT